MTLHSLRACPAGTGLVAVAVFARLGAAQTVSPFAATVQELVARRGDSVERAITRDALERIYRRSSLRPLWNTLGRGQLVRRSLTRALRHCGGRC